MDSVIYGAIQYLLKLEHNMNCEKCETEWLDDDLDYCPICDGDNGETYLIESTTLDDWSN